MKHSLPAIFLAFIVWQGLAPDLADAQRGARGGAQASVNRGGGGGSHAGSANVNRNANVNHNTNTNINSNRNVNVNRDINVDVDHGWNDNYHPIATGVAIGAAAAVTSAVIGSMIYSLPPSCPPYPYNGYTYYSCNGAWYQPQYSGSSVTYVVVNDPH